MPSKKIATTDDFDPPAFRPHGRVIFSQEENMLICDAVGPFNKELIQAIQNVEAEFVEALLAMGKWVEIIVIRESALGSAETVQVFTDYLKSLVSNNLIAVASAIVIDDSVEGAGFMTPILINAYAQAGIKLVAFDTVKEAKAWVKTQL